MSEFNLETLSLHSRAYSPMTLERQGNNIHATYLAEGEMHILDISPAWVETIDLMLAELELAV